MLLTCWSVKGGSGTTVVAAALALLGAERADTAWLVDLCGDGAAVLGAPEPAGPGVRDWLGAPPTVGNDALGRLAVPVSNGVALIPTGDPGPVNSGRWAQLAEALASRGHPVVVDAGTGPPPEALRHAARLDVLVIRSCYLTMRRVAALARPPGGVVVVNEFGRSLRRGDIEPVAGAPVIAEVDWDPSVARSVDAGLLAGRLPRSLRCPLECVAWQQ